MLKSVVDKGIAGFIGLLAGIALAEWVNPATTPAYLSLLVLTLVCVSALVIGARNIIKRRAPVEPDQGQKGSQSN